MILRYMLSPDIFDVFRSTPPGKNGKMQITGALQIQAQQGKVIGYRFKGHRFDFGSVDCFIDAMNNT